MGTRCHVLVLGGSAELVQIGCDRIDQLERRWSRFRHDSELCRINAAAGRPVRVSADTVLAVSAAIDAWHRLDGAFDPTVLDALEQSGYDRTFVDLPTCDDPHRNTAARRQDDEWGSTLVPTMKAAPGCGAPGCGAIVVDPIVSSVQVPVGVRLDLGGIGKGLAADLVADLLMRAGAQGVLVNIGGDLRVAGDHPTPDGWIIGLDALPGRSLRLVTGGLATSAITKRRWWRHGQVAHHVIDPHTSLPATDSAALATVVADCAMAAETLATAALLAGPDNGVALLRAHRASGVIVGRDDTTRTTADLLSLVE